MTGQKQKQRFIFFIRRKKKNGYIGSPRLHIQNVDGLSEPPEEIRNITPKLFEDTRQGDSVTWSAAAGTHSDLEWYADVLEDRGLEVEYFNEDQDRFTVSKRV